MVETEDAADTADMLIARSCALRSRRGPPRRGSVRDVSDERRDVVVVSGRWALPFALPPPNWFGSWSNEVGDVDELATEERMEWGGVSDALEKRWPGRGCCCCWAYRCGGSWCGCAYCCDPGWAYCCGGGAYMDRSECRSDCRPPSCE
ncbi:hypothetical protein C8R44DRAFT_791135 [Mycena epipterygia]|nr:hypothetical protein C8R44DRAFT_791135 [Mycena epipterygia]